MAQRLRVPPPLTKVPSTHVRQLEAACNSTPGYLTPSSSICSHVYIHHLTPPYTETRFKAALKLSKSKV